MHQPQLEPMALRHMNIDPRDAAVDRDDVRLLRALAEGHTTGSAARALGYSERTARRRLAAICDRLNVRSVTAAAVWAARNGLI
ncbi:LuxR C-terminal-related transcriptional regulator [Microbacterium thalassium]|uniref:DNA-binding NarL/FixJ family response regulator n=1 Tax=Microbacterium thalassium TaxID=362649 RepID=A0A7X0FP43_9MICO|nr:LuxR C-terminal-related transcriptional regulator [Microbacterium thalassium]MBB6390532.1 DNA-binding NarL/FixJ family response regulator [Microbacterium thalassium]GLK25643.1 hypothetical protein GCM10017607_29620 [Microbacterium thalassium]